MEDLVKLRDEIDAIDDQIVSPVSYKHLTLPTNIEVYISVVAV